MADVKYDKLELVGHHIPDSTMETNADGIKERSPLPGLYSYGVMLGGVYKEIGSFKAGDIVDEKNEVKTGSRGSSSSSGGKS